jgi:hypothetical protein
MMVNSNPLEGLVKIILVLTGLGAFMGALVSNTDLLNPNTSAAKVSQMNVETAHQQAVYQLEERLAVAKTDAEIQAIKREEIFLNAQYEHDIQILAQDLAHREIAFKTLMTALVIIGGALAVALVLGSILWVGSKALVNIRSAQLDAKSERTYLPLIKRNIHPLPERESYDPWSSPVYRYQKRMAAQQEERKDREKENIISMESFKDPSRMSAEEYNKIPRAD